jgi:F0F1-type ATP synthase membrane subunit b/b'
MNLNPIAQISPVVIVAAIVIVVVTYFALRRIYVAPYLDVLDARDEIFDAANADYATAEELVSAAEAQAEQLVAEAATKAEAMKAAAAESAASYRRTKVAAAQDAATSQLVQGRAEIDEVREREVARMREQACECVRLACARLVGEVDDDVVTATVDRFLVRQD